MNENRGSEKNLLVLDSGDLLFKKYVTPLPENDIKSATQRAHLFVESFNRMGYDALGVGDDDLSLAKDFLVEISKKANFPFLSSNVVDEGSGKLLFQPYLVKEVDGLRFGIFSLLAPETFLEPTDLRKKGLILKPPTEVAQSMVKELQSKSDFIVLLSHLGYPKDVELAQTVSGIHLIVGAHTGMNLVYPPVIKDTILLQTATKGMYVGKLDLTLQKNGGGFYNTTTKRSLENNLRSVTARLNSKEVHENEKAQLRKTREDTERKLKEYQGRNEFSNRILPLTEGMKEDPETVSMIEAYKAKFPDPSKPAPPKP
jgi:2',3'-cyclic-nucleotide 2'-phosphodiesterase (5'-nucleotidase family)